MINRVQIEAGGGKPRGALKVGKEGNKQGHSRPLLAPGSRAMQTRQRGGERVDGAVEREDGIVVEMILDTIKITIKRSIR